MGVGTTVDCGVSTTAGLGVGTTVDLGVGTTVGLRVGLIVAGVNKRFEFIAWVMFSPMLLNKKSRNI